MTESIPCDRLLPGDPLGGRCDGYIDDGYCDVCGKAPRSVGESRPDKPSPGGEQPPQVSPAVAPISPLASPSGVPPRHDAPSHGSGVPPSAAPDPGGSGAAGARTTAWRRIRGLVDLPPITVPEPTSRVLKNPEVPDSKRRCGNIACQAAVGRTRGGARRNQGHCQQCGRRFSFIPHLKPREVLGQYEVVGCLAYGGFGWIYLARDRNVDDRFVVLKGVRDPDDPNARDIALAESGFLAAVDHDDIVKIFNYIEVDDTSYIVSYIVMEFVNGISLQELLRGRRQVDPRAALPPADAAAYILAILPALGHLHQRGLLYCDFKPDNIVVLPDGDGIKLIDLGAVRPRNLDQSDSRWGRVVVTPGYAAPELVTAGPSVAADLYAVGRTLVMLTNSDERLRAADSATERAKPPRYDDSFHRFLLKATRERPEGRFQTADEMGGELLGVFRELVAEPARSKIVITSTRFAVDDGVVDETGEDARLPPAWSSLPMPIAPSADSFGRLPAQGVPRLLKSPSAQLDKTLAQVWERLEEDHEAAADLLKTVQSVGDWRLDWFRGLVALRAERPETAYDSFYRVYEEMPGELCPKLALAMSAELAGNMDVAIRRYDIVFRSDRTFTSAAFGLARCYLTTGDRTRAAAAYRDVPAGSSASVPARVQLIRTLAEVPPDSAPTVDELVDASRILSWLAGRDDRRQAWLTSIILETALAGLVERKLKPDPLTKIVGCRLLEKDVRAGLADAYKKQAEHSERNERCRLVVEANRVRPWSWW